MTPAHQVVVITGASSGFGRLTAESLARAGHAVVAGMRDIEGRNAPNAAALAGLAVAEDLMLSVAELDVQSQASADTAIAETTTRYGRIDVIVHRRLHLRHQPLHPRRNSSRHRG
jgi:NAD(P)-dependent dehydrogenase (short-subunit alcohol dehydrogenase family)